MAERRRRDSNRSKERSGPRKPGRPSVSTTGRKPGAKAGRETRSAPAVHLGDDIVRELRATSRPGKAEILIKVFSEAAGAFVDGDYAEAVRLGEQSKHMALRAASVREFLGLTHYRMGKWKEATLELSAFKRITGSVEQNPVIADCYRAQGKPERALELCDEVTAGSASAPVVYEAAIVAAGALADMKRIDEAIARMQRLDLQPEVAEEHHLRAWYVLGDLLEKKGRFTQAREYFAAVDGADPDLTDARERLSGSRRGGS